MSLAIVGARLLDARSETPLEGDLLLVGDDGRISSIGHARGQARFPEDATVIDAAGLTIVPGLIDCHVHFLGRHERLEDVVARTYTETVGGVAHRGQGLPGVGGHDDPRRRRRARRPEADVREGLARTTAAGKLQPALDHRWPRGWVDAVGGRPRR
jgi:predicted amidohydrolase YtcJ